MDSRPGVHFRAEEDASDLVEGAGYRRKTEQKVDPALVAAELAHTQDDVVVRHFSLMPFLILLRLSLLVPVVLSLGDALLR